MNSTIIRNLNIAKGFLSVVFVAFLIISFHSVTPTPEVFAQGVNPAFPNTAIQSQTLQQLGGATATIPNSQVQPVLQTAGVQNYGDLHGFAWSDMPDGSDQNITPSNQQGGRGLGWISMNGSDTGVSGTYTVSLGSSGAITGDAWSEYGGWLDFAPSGPYPILYLTFSQVTKNVLPTTSVTVDPTCLSSKGSSCAVTGWARFISGEDTNTQNTGGWDGWVNFNGHSYAANSSNTITGTYGVTYDANPSDANFGKFSGFAWGGEVAGWINFDGVSITPTNPLPPGSCTDANATNYGQPSPCTCAGQGSYAGTNFSYSYPFASGASYPAQCSGNSPTPPGGNTASVNLTSSGCSNGSTTLSWTSSGVASCSASYSGNISFSGPQPVNGSDSITGIPQTGSANNVTITCTAQSGYTPATVTSSTSVTCQDPGGPGTPTVPATGTPHPIYKEN